MVSLFGKDMTFYTLLEGQSAAALAAAKAFQGLCADFGNAGKYAAQAEQIETDADALGHQLLDRVDSTFVTPLDKEDLHAMSTALDDITDNIEAAVARVSMYNLPAPNSSLTQLVDLLAQVTQALHDAVGALRNLHSRDTMQTTLNRVHVIINDSDKQFRAAIAGLYDAPNADPILTMKWSQVYDRVEAAVDKCEVMGDLLGSVVIKYA